MKKLLFFVFIFTSVLIILLLFFSLLNRTSKIYDSPENSKNVADSDEDLDVQKQTNDDSEDSELAASDNNEGASEDSSTSFFSGFFIDNCEETKIPYALKNQKSESNCLEYSEDICTRKKVSCLLDLENLDENIEGKFVINFILVLKENNQLLDSIQKETNLSPKSSETLSAEFSVNENANQELECKFFSLETPKTEC